MRSLTLKKETLAELGADELALVVGAAQTLKGCFNSDLRSCLPTDSCLTGTETYNLCQ